MSKEVARTLGAREVTLRELGIGGLSKHRAKRPP